MKSKCFDICAFYNPNQTMYCMVPSMLRAQNY